LEIAERPYMKDMGMLRREEGYLITRQQREEW